MVTVKTTKSEYNGHIYGYRFFDGVAKDVPVKHAEMMASEFSVEIVKSDKPKPKPKPKAKPKPKKVD